MKINAFNLNPCISTGAIKFIYETISFHTKTRSNRNTEDIPSSTSFTGKRSSYSLTFSPSLLFFFSLLVAPFLFVSGYRMEKKKKSPFFRTIFLITFALQEAFSRCLCFFFGIMVRDCSLFYQSPPLGMSPSFYKFMR